MSKSLKRVRAAIEAAGLKTDLREMANETRTAQMAADAVGCDIDQIAKSIQFRGEESGTLWLFVTAGGQRVDQDRAARLAKEPLGPADAATIRRITGFAIGGVAPIGHLTPPKGFFDRHLLNFARIWAAAGTPRHVFGVEPEALLATSGLVLADFTVS
ncbi:MAG: YbaK/EbsC family protein [Pseudorhodobacter sp.]